MFWCRPPYLALAFLYLPQYRIGMRVLCSQFQDAVPYLDARVYRASVAATAVYPGESMKPQSQNRQNPLEREAQNSRRMRELST